MRRLGVAAAALFIAWLVLSSRLATHRGLRAAPTAAAPGPRPRADAASPSALREAPPRVDAQPRADAPPRAVGTPPRPEAPPRPVPRAEAPDDDDEPVTACAAGVCERAALRLEETVRVHVFATGRETDKQSWRFRHLLDQGLAAHPRVRLTEEKDADVVLWLPQWAKAAPTKLNNARSRLVVLDEHDDRVRRFGAYGDVRGDDYLARVSPRGIFLRGIAAAAATRIISDESRRRRGRDADILR